MNEFVAEWKYQPGCYKILKLVATFNGNLIKYH